ncbi:MAG: hypothetical protein J0L70_18195 [Leptolyngbya sp. UWPOB_LEPTO1]|uniref:hypothetical protein n=1 Tax=Leptolyngbya sp. UWPOB_LEPTO1 TaxID=2815653 RepID=UPI001AD1101C|nr:hypothetical protein [Leptolyngbya sp. UWPOB_LEPTO1]MBN8562466.1 hypothetical protein [Leptolyngbya sp. UWPOB_LEPTO1]
MEKRKWSEAECQRWFVQGSGKLTELAQLSNTPYGTLKRWCTVGKWVEKRKQFRAELSQQTQTKTIDKSSDVLAEQWSKLTIEHLQSFQILRKLAEAKAKLIHNKLEALQVEKEMRRSLGQSADEIESEQAVALDQISIDDISVCTRVIDTCIKGERMVLSMEYQDLNRAAAAIERVGLKIVAPSDSTLARLTVREGESNG